MSIITRGNFLKLSLSALMGALLASLIACVNKINSVNIIKNPIVTGKSSSSEESGSSTEKQSQNETASATTTSSQKENIEKKAIVGIAGGEDKISVLVGKAIELAGGLGFINKGSTVLIKPNLNTGDPHPASTNPEVVYEVINLVKKQNPYRIFVGDRSGFWLDTIDCMQQSKIYDAAVSAGAEVYPFDDEEWIKVNPEMAQTGKVDLEFLK